jgi:hypothetical protein
MFNAWILPLGAVKNFCCLLTTPKLSAREFMMVEDDCVYAQAV